MNRNLKYSTQRRKALVILIGIGILIEFLLVFEPRTQNAETNLIEPSIEIWEEGLLFVQDNSLLPVIHPFNPEPKVIRKIKVVATGYSSTSWETDNEPYITAAGTWVKDGIVANNGLPLGTKIKIPELYGEKIFVVEDRMNWEKGKYHIDIWFSSYQEAKDFGAKRTYIEVLES